MQSRPQTRKPRRPRTAKPARRRRKQGRLSDEGQGTDPRRQGTGGDIELNDEIFAVEPRADILHRVVTWQLDQPPRLRRARRASAATSPAPARSSAARRAAAPLVTATAALRSSSAAARPTARAPAMFSLEPQQEGPRARPQDGAVVEGDGRPADRASTISTSRKARPASCARSWASSASARPRW